MTNSIAVSLVIMALMSELQEQSSPSDCSIALLELVLLKPTLNSIALNHSSSSCPPQGYADASSLFQIWKHYKAYIFFSK